MVTTKTYTFSNVTADHTIAATFAKDPVTVHISASISNAVRAGFENKSFTARYKINSGSWTTITWNGDNEWADSGTGGHGFYWNGTPTDVTVAYGDSITLEIQTVPTGYTYTKTSVISTSHPTPTDYTTTTVTLTNVTETTTMSVNYTGSTYTITTSMTGTGTGSITPAGPVTAYYGEDVTFTVTSDTGCHIQEIAVDGTPIPLE